MPGNVKAENEAVELLEMGTAMAMGAYLLKKLMESGKVTPEDIYEVMDKERGQLGLPQRSHEEILKSLKETRVKLYGELYDS